MRRIAAATLLAATVAAPAAAQVRSGELSTGVRFQGYELDDALGVEAVNLLLIPIAYQLTIGDRLGFDLYSAYARGAALIGGTEFVMAGPVDTRVRANYQVAPWVVLTFGLNLPTGAASQTEDEARVAAVLATDLFGFREANFGLGFGATTGIAAAHRIGETGVGFGASYRLASEFEPRADTAFKYAPGNEVRIRVGVDRNIGSNKLTAGVTYQNFQPDRLDGRNLFQAGNRWRGDVTYSFRTGTAATWTAYLTDVWREQGDLQLGELDSRAPSDSTLVIGTQNLMLLGMTGSWRISPALTVMPVTELRRLTRQDEGGEGWMLGAGAAVPLRYGSIALRPGGRLNFGSLAGAEIDGRTVWGGELNLTIGWVPR